MAKKKTEKKSDNPQLKMFFSGLEVKNKKQLKKQSKEISKTIKKLRKDKKANQYKIKKQKSALKSIDNRIEERIRVNMDGTTVTVKKSYIERLKDPEKWLEHKHRQSIERKIYNAENEASKSGKNEDYRKLNNLINKYEKTFKGSEGYKKGIVNSVNSQLEVKEKEEFSTFFKKEKSKTEYDKQVSLNEDNWSIKISNI